MSTELMINGRPYETRVALVENGVVTEYRVERDKDRGITGNIYMGQVVRVLPGMQAAFVDIGLDKAAFLYVADVYDDQREFEAMMMSTYAEEDEDEREHIIAGDIQGQELPAETRFQIQDLLHEGQEVMVQVSKEPISTKGARVTTHVSLPGRNLVLMPMMDRVGVSRRIEDEEERARLRHMIMSIKPPDMGFIARTAAEDENEAKVRAEMDFLLKLWGSIQQKKKTAKAPCLLHRDLGVALRAVRELFTKDVDKLVIDSREEYDAVLQFIRTFMPTLSHAVELYENLEPIFDRYGIEMDISRALEKKVWLKSGGYIVIEMTEALVSIDVNTGRYVGKRKPEETILKTNLEAVKEILYQLRLRNIGGLIVIDFIDMEREVDREKVFNALKEGLRKDKNKTRVLRMSELGLIEMTRKRTRDNINSFLTEPCFYCEGEGRLKSMTSICYDVFRSIEREVRDIPGQSVYVRVHPEVSDMLLDEEHHHIEYLERRIKKSIVIKPYDGLHIEQFMVGAY